MAPETRAKINTATPPPRREKGEVLRLLWTAGFESRKGIIFLIEALQLLKESKNEIPYKLIIAGDGIRRKAIIGLCDSCGIDYEYLGLVPYTKMPELYLSSHLHFLPSLSDATTTVVFEALVNYCPVIALNHLSFSEIINDSCGRKINLETRTQIAKDIANHISFFYYNEDERYKLSLGARKRAEEYSWEKKIKLIDSIYRKLVNEGRTEKE